MKKLLSCMLSGFALASTCTLEAIVAQTPEKPVPTQPVPASSANPMTNVQASSSPCLSNHVRVNEGWNVGVFGGATWAHTSIHPGTVKFDTGYLFGALMGYKWNIGLEFDAEGTFRRNDMDSYKFNDDHWHILGHIRTWAAMGNLKYYLPLDWYVIPYFGGGAGYAETKQKIDSLNGRKIHGTRMKNGFAWQAIFGLSSTIKWFDLDAEYRYFRGKHDTWYHSVDLALKYFF